MTTRAPRLTEDDRADIVRMLGEGKPYSEIAEWIGCNVSTVKVHARDLGVKSSFKKTPPDNRRVKEEGRAEIRRMVAERRTTAEIAHRLGIAKRTAFRHIREMSREGRL